MIRRRCTVCGRLYGHVTEEHQSIGKLDESHGVCPDCADAWERKLERELKESLGERYEPA